MSIFTKQNSGRRYLVAAIVVAALQSAVLGYVIESRASILRSGADALLKTAPVDPRDFLRGDYVVLNYDISSVPVASIVGGVPQDQGRKSLWVRLKPGEDGFFGIVESSFERLPEEPGTVVVRSRPFYSDGSNSADHIRVEYGIERYYVPEGQGTALEKARQGGDVSIAIRVGSDGTAQIRSLLVDRKPAYDEPLY
ncbi:putative membrane-anchored protein [Rhizobium mesoamericanum]|uniref:GDYXXLXY domain-containing protein n=1 Tax=Rhizobium mesoamericanum TaxID=1079800 RepID=UPI0027852A8F|nr:GDYXXLXY domain-containing protein [Rhizobium mesoamericanum]MDQ0564096.1 putative membrane-anchored protein [Rhizobium mesoamericanum]